MSVLPKRPLPRRHLRLGPRPSIEQVVIYFAYLIPVLFLFFWDGGSKATVKAQTPESKATKPSTVSVGASQA